MGRFEGDVYQMKEWQLMVHVIQGKGFAGPDLKLYVCIQIDSAKRYTGVHRCTNSPFFGEVYLYIESLSFKIISWFYS